MAECWRFLRAAVLIFILPFLAEGSVYENASHYWPLDYVTKLTDIVTRKEATVSGTGDVRMNGKGDGFMEMQVGKAAIRLGEYSHKCLLSPKECDNGLSFTFWLRLQEAPVGQNVTDLLCLKSNTNFYVFTVMLESYPDGTHMLTYSAINGQWQYRARVRLNIMEWVHSSLIFSTSGDFRVVVNGRTSVYLRKAAHVSGKAEKVDLMIGSWRSLGSPEGVKLQFDEIAMFFQELDASAIQNIVSKNYGSVGPSESCSGNKSAIVVMWEPPIDTYDHVLRYVITARSSSLYTQVVSKDARRATLTGLDANVEYQIEVVAQTISGLNITSPKIFCSTSGSKKMEVEGRVNAFAIDTERIRVIWKPTKDSVDRPVAYGVSINSEGESAKYVLLFAKDGLNHTVTGLKENREYLVTVTVFMRLGNRRVEEQKVRTKRIILLPTSPVQNLSIANVTWNSASAQWVPPRNYSDPAIVYQVECKGGNQSYVTRVLDGHVIFDNLQQDSWYKVTVMVGARGVGFHHQVMTVNFRTQVRFPPPAVVNATALKWDTVLLEWGSVQRTGHLMYQVAYYEQAKKAEKTIIQTRETTLQVRNLKMTTKYAFIVKTGNGTVFGEGSSKEVLIVTPDRNECADGSHACTSTARCIDTEAGYQCICNHGYIRDGATCKPIEQSEPNCSTDYAKNVTWRQTQHGQSAFAKCPKGTDGMAQRYCKQLNRTHAAWLAPDLSDCISIWLRQFSHQMQGKTGDSPMLMKSLSTEYARQTRVSGGDVQAMVSMIGDIISITNASASGSSALGEMAKGMVAVTDDLLSNEKSKSWGELPKKKKAKSASRILQNFENLAKVYSSSLKNGSLKISKPNAVVEVRKLVDESSLKFAADGENEVEPALQSSISLPPSSFNFGSNGVKGVYFGFFRGIEEFLGTDMANSSNGEKQIGRISNVIAATVLGRERVRFEKPIVITQKLPSKNTNGTNALRCLFWDFAGNNTVGGWSERGCSLHSSNETHAICHCSHLTNFAILMSVTVAPLHVEKAHEDRMSVITIVCICISLVALFASFITFCAVRSLQSYRNTTHKNLVVALFLAQLLFICGVNRTAHLLTCRLIGMTLHYLFLVAFALMGMEGFVLYTMLVRVYQRNSNYSGWKLLVTCWGLPLIIVGVTAGIDYTAYGTEKYCWISVENGYIWSFVGPVIVVVAFNCFIMALAVNVMRKKSKRREEKIQEIWYWIKCCSMLVSILGLSWVIGIFYINQQSVIMGYVFSCLNALQGLALFVFLCLFDHRVQDVYCRVFCCIERGHFYLYASRSVSGTKSTAPVTMGTLRRDTGERRSLNKARISLANQEVELRLADGEEHPGVDV